MILEGPCRLKILTMALNPQHYPETTQQGLSAVTPAHPFMHNRSHGKETQLRFNLDVPTHSTNLAAQFSNPSPITIEKISTTQNKPSDNLASEDLLRNSCSSVSFSVVSEESLNFALQLAKRDLKLKHLGKKLELKSKSHPHQGSPKTKSAMLLHSPEKVEAKPQIKKSRIKHEVTESGARVYVYTPDWNRTNIGVTHSPPTHDSGPGESPKKGVEQSEQEIKRLQKELHTYMRKIEELAKKERDSKVLDPSEEARGRIRQQQRAARSARMLYVLQQQVKEIHEDLEKLSPQKIKHTKKSRTMSRLAAAHRGAIRALQMFITQLSERGEQQIPSLYKELGHLIRQLSLCTAKLESGSDPTSTNMIISILQQVEDLDTLLEDKISSREKKSPNIMASRSPPTVKDSNNIRSPVRALSCFQPVYKETAPHKENWTRVSRQLVLDNPPESLNGATHTEPKLVQELTTPERREAIRSGLEALIQASRLKGLPRKGVGQNRSKGVLLPQRPKVFRQSRKTDLTQPAHFQEKTVAFKLKQNQPIVRERKTPWVPPNPTSPPASPKRVNWERESKRLNVSPSRKLDQSDALNAKETEKEEARTREALRLTWLDSETARRMQQLDDLYREEIAHLRMLREEAHAVKRLPDEHYASNNMPRQQKYQEAVRNRFTRIVYSDPEFWAQEERERTHVPTDQRPHSPHPIRITKPTGQCEPVVNILLEEPFEGDSSQIKELVRTSPHHIIQHSATSTKDHLHLSVPPQMLRSIHNYTERFNQHLRLTSHEEVGAFNPWHISERLAEDLIDDALGEVAAELQDLCEGYAEAVFTSEFMEPTEL
ncbi:protein moonraker isoform X2 [Mixophyes fleayi]|uniref:protein moonraker isoform X2 n=1 Tax=Mixophyes fleayi TaxID=3061075 RepID=UPI003F4D7BBC